MTEEQYLWAWLDGYMAGVERGKEELTREQNADWPPPRVLTFGRWYDQAIEREKWYAAARLPRPGDIEHRKGAAA